MPLTIVALFILILLALVLLWWILAVVFKPIGKVVEHDVEKFKKCWNEKDEDNESKTKFK